MIIIGAAKWGGPFAIRRAQLSKKRTISQCYVAGGWPRLNSGVAFPLRFWPGGAEAGWGAAPFGFKVRVFTLLAGWG
jgi:hypothetical protein